MAADYIEEYHRLNDKASEDFGEGLSPYEAWGAAIKFMEAKFTSYNSVMDAIVALVPVYMEHHELTYSHQVDIDSFLIWVARQQHQ